ncbi:MAG: sulfotransferase [Planctomycetales bacterium]|nr:sulfotransferase [Planctomycetales bacterium]NIM08658.1 sulfotransferase [Planctomycetales bacterium]NIN08128.1 sulfotransferase [Planctomycetales bacterium]NIN77253.1 sulfotransferase [Planctomycetales bacterium]NIO34442.1 sulfotransferase [Planctomycetales bacterium]
MNIPATKKADPLRLNKYPWYTPRFWDGMRTRTWWKLMWRHRFDWSLSRLHIAMGSLLLVPFHSACYRWQERRWRRKVEATSIRQSPIFVLGHWRSGTTFLHELLVLDDRHSCATTYECFSPNDFLSTGKFITRWFGFVMPKRRPMDNMAAGWERPQEDEFALLNMGIPSIYETLAFPDHGPQNLDSLDFANFSAQEIRRWQDGWMWFLRRVNFRDPRRLVLKSPPHMARIPTLLKLFPDAKFIHIFRNPYDVFASSVRLWQALCQTQSLQSLKPQDWDELVLTLFERLYEAFERDRDSIPAGNFCEVRYEDLVANPLEQIERIYTQLQLDGFADARAAIQRHLKAVGHHRVHRHALTSEARDRIAERWARYLHKYGYC